MENYNQTDEVLTTQEVADRWKVHRTTISRLAKSGELKSYMIGRCRRFKESDCRVFFDNQVDGNFVVRKEN